MFTPSIFGESLFDDWMDDFEKEFDKESGQRRIRCMVSMRRT